MLLPIIFYPDAILDLPCKKVPEVDEKIKKLCEDMKTALYTFSGHGLAAPQIGESLRIFVTLLDNEPQVFINPKISTSGKKIKANEGCLSLPGVTANLHCRYESTVVEALDENGEEIVRSLHGIESVAVQHEHDHLLGKTIFSRMGSAQRHMKRSKYLKWHKKFTAQQEKAENERKRKENHAGVATSKSEETSGEQGTPDLPQSE